MLILEWNKYLGELGVEKDTYPLKDSFNGGSEHGLDVIEEAGVLSGQTWNLNLTLAMVLYCYMRAYREAKLSHPIYVSKKDWDKILEDIIDGFAEYIKAATAQDVSWSEQEAKAKLLRRSLKLMGKHWEALWW